MRYIHSDLGNLLAQDGDKAKLAKSLGVHPTQISGYCRVRDPKIPTLPRALEIAEALGVSVHDIYELEES